MTERSGRGLPLSEGVDWSVSSVSGIGTEELTSEPGRGLGPAFWQPASRSTQVKAARIGINRRFMAHHLMFQKTKRPSIPKIQGRKASLPRYHPHSYTLVRAQSPDNGGQTVPLSGAAPRRTKGPFPGRLSAGDLPSLTNTVPLFSCSPQFTLKVLISQKRRECKSSRRKI